MKKKLPLYVLEIALQLQHWSKFAQKTYVSEKVLIKVQMSCALELKPHLYRVFGNEGHLEIDFESMKMSFFFNLIVI